MPKILIGEQKNNGVGYNKDLAATLLEGFNHVSYNIKIQSCMNHCCLCRLPQLLGGCD